MKRVGYLKLCKHLFFNRLTHRSTGLFVMQVNEKWNLICAWAKEKLKRGVSAFHLIEDGKLSRENGVKTTLSTKCHKKNTLAWFCYLMLAIDILHSYSQLFISMLYSELTFSLMYVLHIKVLHTIEVKVNLWCLINVDCWFDSNITGIYC